MELVFCWVHFGVLYWLSVEEFLVLIHVCHFRLIIDVPSFLFLHVDEVAVSTADFFHLFLHVTVTRPCDNAIPCFIEVFRAFGGPFPK